MYETLQIIQYPDPRLRRIAKPVTEFEESLRELVNKLFELMRANHGVGLAAPQVGLDLRLFVMNATGKPEDDRVYINPELFDLAGDDEGEEGCLSLPDIRAMIHRGLDLRIVAKDVDGKKIEHIDHGYVARIWQHEFDHLNGVMIIDRMGDSAKMGHRKKLRELEEEFEIANPPPPKIAKASARKVATKRKSV